MLVARREKLLQEVAEDITSHGGRAVCCPADVADPTLTIPRRRSSEELRALGIDIQAAVR